MATPLRSMAFPINPYQLHNNSQPNFGRNPFKRSGLRGCGCSPTEGCGCTKGLGAVSLDSIIQNGADWLSGVAQSQLPQDAAYPPGYSKQSLTNSLIQYAPYIIGGFLLYKLLK